MATAKKSGVKALESITPAFHHKGVDYKWADFEKACKEGSKEHLALVPELVKLGQLIEVEAPKAAQSSKSEDDTEKEEEVKDEEKPE